MLRTWILCCSFFVKDFIIQLYYSFFLYRVVSLIFSIKLVLCLQCETNISVVSNGFKFFLLSNLYNFGKKVLILHYLYSLYDE